ncbi:MAG: PHB depolymerase family esterase [Pseudomonadota bacterium]
MAKSLSSLWLKTAKRMGRVQQAQGQKLFKSLLKTAAKTSKKAITDAARSGATVKTPVKKTRAVARPAAKKAAVKSRPAPKPLVSASQKLPGSWQKAVFSWPVPGAGVASRRLLYWLYIPRSAPAGGVGRRMPLVVMLHGCQQSVEDFATSTRMNALAERKGFAVLYPQQSAGHDANRCWPWYKRAALMAAMVAQVQATHGLDTARTYVAGLSAGAGLAVILAVRHPQLFAAVGLHSSPVFGTADSAVTAYRAMQQGGVGSAAAALAAVQDMPQLAIKPGMPVMVIHGDRDAVVRRINQQQLVQQFSIINAACITNTEPVRSNTPARVGGRSPRHGWQTVTYMAGSKPQIVSCEIAGLGHAWSGGDASVAFSTREGPDASLMLWMFFARHRRAVAGRR